LIVASKLLKVFFVYTKIYLIKMSVIQLLFLNVTRVKDNFRKDYLAESPLNYLN